jgi:hypothetical protein
MSPWWVRGRHSPLSPRWVWGKHIPLCSGWVRWKYGPLSPRWGRTDEKCTVPCLQDEYQEGTDPCLQDGYQEGTAPFSKRKVHAMSQDGYRYGLCSKDGYEEGTGHVSKMGLRKAQPPVPMRVRGRYGPCPQDGYEEGTVYVPKLDTRNVYGPCSQDWYKECIRPLFPRWVREVYMAPVPKMVQTTMSPRWVRGMYVYAPVPKMGTRKAPLPFSKMGTGRHRSLSPRWVPGRHRSLSQRWVPGRHCPFLQEESPLSPWGYEEGMALFHKRVPGRYRLCPPVEYKKYIRPLFPRLVQGMYTSPVPKMGTRKVQTAMSQDGVTGTWKLSNMTLARGPTATTLIIIICLWYTRKSLMKLLNCNYKLTFLTIFL